MLSLAFEKDRYYLNMVRGGLETKLAFSQPAMKAFLELYWLQQPKKTALITICPERETQSELDTNGLSYLDILDGLEALSIGLARQVIETAEDHVGTNPDRIAKWVDFMRQHPEDN